MGDSARFLSCTSLAQAHGPVKRIACVRLGGAALGSNCLCARRLCCARSSCKGRAKVGRCTRKGADAGKGATPCSVCVGPITHFLPQYWMPYFQPVCQDCFYAWDGHKQANARVVSIAETMLPPPVSQRRGANEGGKRRGKGRYFGVRLWCRGQLESPLTLCPCRMMALSGPRPQRGAATARMRAKAAAAAAAASSPSQVKSAG